MAGSRIGEVPDPKRVPAPEATQPVNIRPGSAMAIVGLFVEVIRRRFTQESALPWVWFDDIRSGGDQGIAIESAFNEDQDHRNYRAAIYVDRDELIIGRTVLGDLAGQHLPSGLRAFWALESVPLLVECVAAKKAESAVLADLVGIYLHASSKLIQAKFGLHDMTPLTMGRTQPFPRDKTQWVTPISFTVQFNLRWTSTPTAPILREIELSLEASGFESATAYFESVAMDDG
jgi:hypothetical protein